VTVATSDVSQLLRLPSSPPARWSERTLPAAPARRRIATAVPPGDGGSANHGRRGTRQGRPATPLRGRSSSEFDLTGKEAHASNAHLAPAAWYSFPKTPMRQTTRLELLLPLADNDGIPFPDAAFAAFEDFLVSVAGGFTRRADVEGAWRAPDGRVMRDRSRSYVVSVPVPIADRVASQIDQYVRRQFRQQAAYVESVPARAVAF